MVPETAASSCWLCPVPPLSLYSSDHECCDINSHLFLLLIFFYQNVNLENYKIFATMNMTVCPAAWIISEKSDSLHLLRKIIRRWWNFWIAKFFSVWLSQYKAENFFQLVEIFRWEMTYESLYERDEKIIKKYLLNNWFMFIFSLMITVVKNRNVT